AGTMMLIIGVYQVFMGIAAIAKDDFFVVAPNYAYKVNTTSWGWIHLILGALILAAGFFVFTGALWARAIGIAMAALSAIANFFFLPYYPLWSLLVIALDIFAIWALASVGRRNAMMGGDDGRYGSGGSAMPASGMAAGGMAASGAAAGAASDRWTSTNPSDYTNPSMAGRRAPDMSAEARKATESVESAMPPGTAGKANPGQHRDHG
ncbi:MAG TPA: hypothetical protein VFE14_05995, partial [Micromonosporaceae bacterium]|nr:hypothetical protein [Micromonosporaceae bacterium]